MVGNNNNSTPNYNSAKTKSGFNGFKKPKLFYMALVTLLCSFSYFFGVYQHTHSNPTTTTTSLTKNCLPIRTQTSLEPIVTNLDFSSRHSGNEDEKSSSTSQMVSENVYDFPPCDIKYSEYTPCEDLKRSLKFSRDKLIYKERHCPEKEELLKCRIPAPHGYKKPFAWPRSRDYAWFANVPHKHLTVEKASQNWIRYEAEEDRFRFPGGGTMFPNGADKYIDDIGKLINLKDGSIRTAIDTGCGVASWGAYLLSRDILTVSFAPKDTNHEAQVQFALERGVPGLIGILASIRLPYPSRAFDMAHCSRCLIPWGKNDGQYLIEVDRILRPGGYWILSGPPINWREYHKGWKRTREDLNSEQSEIEAVAKSLCWKKFAEKGDIAIWKKPLNHIQCKSKKKLSQNPSFCQTEDPDRAWYTKLRTCLTPLPNVSSVTEIAGGKLRNWPERLTATPPRIISGSTNGITEKMFKEDTHLWNKRIAYYKTKNYELKRKGIYRNLLDMNAHLGGFAAALADYPLWVMNVVPNEAKINTLGVIYERGLIGTYQNWCEAMSSYPRTYDFMHADSVLTLYKNRCEMEDILLEMDRMLRPEGSVIFRDDVDVLLKAKSIADGLKWNTQLLNHEDGPLIRVKILFAVKTYWTALQIKK